MSKLFLSIGIEKNWFELFFFQTNFQDFFPSGVSKKIIEYYHPILMGNQITQPFYLEQIKVSKLKIHLRILTYAQLMIAIWLLCYVFFLQILEYK